MSEVYELEFEDQRDPQNYGLFATLQNAEKYLKEVLHVDLSKKSVYFGGGRIVYDQFVITRRTVK